MLRYFNVKACGTYNNHYVLRGNCWNLYFAWWCYIQIKNICCTANSGKVQKLSRKTLGGVTAHIS